MSRPSHLVEIPRRDNAGSFEPVDHGPRNTIPQDMEESSALSAAIADPNITVFQYRVSKKPYLSRRAVVNGWAYTSLWFYPGIDSGWNFTWISAEGLSADVLQRQFYRLDGCSVTPYILKAVPGFMLGQEQDKTDQVSLVSKNHDAHRL